MADEKLNTGPAENISPEAAEPIATPEQAAASEPQQEQTGPAIPEPGDVVVSFDKINELIWHFSHTKTVEYEDINYSVASTEDQTAIFSGWSSFLNYFDSSLPFQLSFINRRSHSRSRYQVNIPKADDNYNSVRDEFTGIPLRSGRNRT